VKPKDKILTYQQARELKFFTDNCMGVRQEYYELLGKVTEFGQKIERLSKQGLFIEDFLRRNPGERAAEIDAPEMSTKTNANLLPLDPVVDTVGVSGKTMGEE
jgi:hypothetical protein